MKAYEVQNFDTSASVCRVKQFRFHIICGQWGSGTHPASYPVGTMDSFPGVKRSGREADHSPQSIRGPYLDSPNTPSLRGTELKHRDKFTFKLYLKGRMN
jgi:hypothetical protein